MKGTERNGPCSCGSGIKAKRCVGSTKHRLSPEQLDALHAEALDENYYYHTDEGRFTLQQMTAASRRRAQRALQMLTAIGGVL